MDWEAIRREEERERNPIRTGFAFEVIEDNNNN